MRLQRMLIVTAVFVLSLLLAALPAAAQQGDVTPARAGGIDRYATAAIAMEQVAFAEGTNTAIITTGADFPDALTAAGLAGQAGAAVLLTQPDELPQATATTLIELGVENVYVLGGPDAVDEDVVGTLQGENRDVARIGGDDRYETAAEVAREVAELGPLSEVGGEPAAFLATGEEFADAVTAGAPAFAGTPSPILLTETDTLPQATVDALNDLGIGHLWVIGGEAAISPGVVDQLQTMGIETQRLAGEDRQATAVEVARTFIESMTLQGDIVTLARGDLFPDALVGGVTAARTGGPVLLTDSPEELGTHTADYLANPAAGISVIRAMGERQAVSTAVLDRAVEIAAEGGQQVEQSWILAPQEPVTVSAGATTDEFRLVAGEGETLPSQATVALFDCRVTDPTGTGQIFQDNDNDGLADGYATTEAGAAAITFVNGTQVDGTKVVDGVQPQDGAITFKVFSQDPDCAVPVVFADTNETNAQLDVNDAGQPVEPFNVGLVTFQ